MENRFGQAQLILGHAANDLAENAIKVGSRTGYFVTRRKKLFQIISAWKLY
jgi:hypothetical protein